MRINNTSPQPSYYIATLPDKAPKDKPVTPTTKPSAPTTAEPPVAAESGTHERGVLRLLEEGHFKPVADVRLRINFYDELAAKANANTNAAVQGAGEELVTDLTAAGENLFTPDQQDALAAWNENLDTLRQALTDASSDRATLEAAAKTATDNFLTRLTELLADNSTPVVPPTTDETTDETTEPTDESATSPASPADGTQAADPTPPLSNTTDSVIPSEPPVASEPAAGAEDPRLASFRDRVQQYIDGLSVLLAQADTAMQITPAENVSGRAYDKFLAIYQNMASPPETQTPEPETTPVDTSA